MEHPLTPIPLIKKQKQNKDIAEFESLNTNSYMYHYAQ